MEKEAIIEAFKANPALVGEILPSITDAEPVKQLIENKSNVLFEEKIGEKIKEVHQKYDDDLFETLGVRAGTTESGAKQKTYEVVKTKLVELKTLQGQKDSLNKDAEVIKLKGEIEVLKTTGGGKEFKEMLETSKTQWEAKETEYKKQLQTANQSKEDFQKSVSIKTAFSGLKFNPDVPESARKAIVDNVEKELVKNSKLNEDGKLVFLGEDGKILMNAQYQPKTAEEVLESLAVIKDISLKDGNKGGGAKEEITGSIKTIKVEGKDDAKKLILPEGIKTKKEFTEQAEKALLASGITKRDVLFNKLKDEAYIDLEIGKLPLQ